MLVNSVARSTLLISSWPPTVWPRPLTAVLRGELALIAQGEVAGAGVLERRAAAERVGGGGGSGRRGAARHAEPAGAGDGDVVRAARRLERAVGHEVVDRAELDAEADLGRLRAGATGRGRGAGALHLGQRVAERRAACLEAHGVDVGQVVGRDVKHDLVVAQSADGGVHASHHERNFLSGTPASSERSSRSWVWLAYERTAESMLVKT